MEHSFTRGELIGLFVEIIDAKNRSLVGLSGKIIDETKAMLILDCGKKLVKEQVKLRFKYDGKVMDIDGKLLVGRCEDRLKKVLKKF